MNAEKLRMHAELLESAIVENRARNDDVEWLANYRPLIEAIASAKSGVITKSLDLGLGRWELESDVRSIPAVSHRLAQFELLLEGFDLPSDKLEAQGLGDKVEVSRCSE